MMPANLRIPRSNLILLFSLAFAVKFILAVYLSGLTHCSAPDVKLGAISVHAGDTFSYTGAMENYIDFGKYFFFNGERDVLAGRLPHYSIPYYIFRFFFTEDISNDLVVGLQVLVECIAIVVFALLASRLFKSKLAFYLSYMILLLSANHSNYNYQLSPESLSISFLVIFLYFFFKYQQYSKLIDLVLTGIFLGLLVVLKPYFALIYPVVGMYILFRNRCQFRFYINFYQVVRQGFILSLPLLIFLLPWVIRNYNVLNRFVLLQEDSYAGYNYSEADLACRRFIQAWGGNFIYWDKSTAGCYFIPTESTTCAYTFPNYAFAKGYNLSDIEKIREKYVAYQITPSDSLEREVALGFDKLTKLYKDDKPLRYYVLAPLMYVKMFIVQSGSYYLPINSSFDCYEPFQLVFKYLQSLIYWIVIVFGFIGLFLMARENISWIILINIPVILLILFPVVLRAVEWRYFIHGFQVLILGLVYVLLILGKRFGFKFT